MTPNSRKCLNCDREIDEAFCPNCGQAAATKRLTLREVLTDGFTHLFELDSRVLRTVIGLTRNPGRMCREYVEGKRVAFVQPLKYFLTIVAAVLVVYAFIGFEIAKAAPDFGLEMSERTEEVQRYASELVGKRLNIVLIIALPFFAAIVWLLFHSSGLSYAEVGAFVLYVMGHVLLFSLVIAAVRPGLTGPIIALRLGLQLAYFSWAAIVFFRVSVVVGIVKSLVATISYLMIVAVIVAVMIGPRLVEIMNAG